MRVRYRPAWAGIFLALGAFLAVMWFLGKADTVQLAIGVFFVVAAVLTLTRDYFEFDPATRTIELKVFMSPQVRRFGGAGSGELDVVGQRIVYRRADGSHRNVPVMRLFARRTEWDAVLDCIASPAPTNH